MTEFLDSKLLVRAVTSSFEIAGEATDASNCQMLCKTHNRAKGNR